MPIHDALNSWARMWTNGKDNTKSPTDAEPTAIEKDDLDDEEMMIMIYDAGSLLMIRIKIGLQWRS